MTEKLDPKPLVDLVRQYNVRGHTLGEAYTLVAERAGVNREYVVTAYLRATASPIFQ